MAIIASGNRAAPARAAGLKLETPLQDRASSRELSVELSIDEFLMHFNYVVVPMPG